MLLVLRAVGVRTNRQSPKFMPSSGAYRVGGGRFYKHGAALALLCSLNSKIMLVSFPFVHERKTDAPGRHKNWDKRGHFGNSAPVRFGGRDTPRKRACFAKVRF